MFDFRLSHVKCRSSTGTDSSYCYCYFFLSFSHQCYPIFSHKSLSDSKSSQVSRTLLSILADLNNAVICMFSSRPLISKSFYQSFGDCTKCTNYYCYYCQFHILQFFQFPSQVQVFIFLFTFFQFYPLVHQSPPFFVVDYYKVWSSRRDYVIRYYLKIPVKFVGFILQKIFLAMHIPPVRMVEFKLLSQFPGDHRAYPVVSGLILLLC